MPKKKSGSKKHPSEWHWYTFCDKHLKMFYRKSTDGYCKANKDVQEKYPCGVRDTLGRFCQKKVKYEFYPDIAKGAKHGTSRNSRKKRKR